MNKMHVYSLDYDGCMAARTIEEIIATNTDLIDEMIGLINNGEEVRVCVGSNRQNRVIDLFNSDSKRTPSVFKAYPALVDYIKNQIKDENKKKNIQFDGFLTVDALNDVKCGTHFKEYGRIQYVREGRPPKASEIPPIRDEDYENNEKCMVDETKISILYAQMHHFASLNRSKQVEFIFKDDKEDILRNLHTFYSQHPELIPTNVTLKIEQKLSQEALDAIEETKKSAPSRDINEVWGTAVRTKQFSKVSPINGSGHIDSDYAATSRAMLVLAYNITYGNEVNNLCSSDIKTGVINNKESTGNIYRGYLSADCKQTNEVFFNAFNEYRAARSKEINDEVLISRQKKFALSFATAGFIIGAAIGVALVATGVLAPLGIGVLATAAIVGAVGGVTLASLGEALGVTVAKHTEPSNADIDKAVASNADNVKDNLGSYGGPLASILDSKGSFGASSSYEYEAQSLKKQIDNSNHIYQKPVVISSDELAPQENQMQMAQDDSSLRLS